MNPFIRNILSIIVGFVIGSIVNMAIIKVSGSIIPPPEGVDVSNMESLKSSMHLFEPKHFVFPFLAHALGAFVGAWVAASMAANHKLKFAIAIGVLFLFGGIAASFMLPAPIWFIVVDLALAYVPMAYLGWKLTERKSPDAEIK